MTQELQKILKTVDGGKHLDYLVSASLEEIEEYLQQYTTDSIYRQFALAERQKRHFHFLSKPHWSLTPGFIVAVFAMLFAAIAAWPVVREWFPASPPAHTDSSFPPPLLRSAPVSPPVSQK